MIARARKPESPVSALLLYQQPEDQLTLMSPVPSSTWLRNSTPCSLDDILHTEGHRDYRQDQDHNGIFALDKVPDSVLSVTLCDKTVER